MNKINVEAIPTPRFSRGRLTGIEFSALCHDCGATASGQHAPWRAAGFVASWAAAHSGLEPRDDVPVCTRGSDE